MRKSLSRSVVLWLSGLVALCAFCPALCPAVTIVGGAGSGNTTEASVNAYDPTFPYWRNVGQISKASPFVLATGVYIGNQWVLTAKHVANPGVDDAFDLTVTNSSNVSQTLTRDTSIPIVTLAPDLIAYKVLQDPGLATIPIRSTALTLSEPTGIVIGNGLDRRPDLYYYRVDTTPTTWVWDAPNTVPQPLTGAWDSYGAGYLSSLTGSQSVRWGTNAPEILNFTDTGNQEFLSVFDADLLGVGATPFEMQANFGDSGGGFFIKNGSTWELAGITRAAYTDFPAQPSALIFNGSLTGFFDLFQYRDLIDPLTTVPEPASAALMGGLILFTAGHRRRRA